MIKHANLDWIRILNTFQQFHIHESVPYKWHSFCSEPCQIQSKQSLFQQPFRMLHELLMRQVWQQFLCLEWTATVGMYWHVGIGVLMILIWRLTVTYPRKVH